jgi:hypothetical protein
MWFLSQHTLITCSTSPRAAPVLGPHQSSGRTSPRATPPKRARLNAFNQLWTQRHAQNHLKEVVGLFLQPNHLRIKYYKANVELPSFTMF